MAVLALDVSGLPRKWVSFDDAITYKAKNLVAWTMGNVVAKYNGGVKKDGTRSYLETHSIIAIKGSGFTPSKFPTVSLTNRTLFGRDRNTCAYCGDHFGTQGRTRTDNGPASKAGRCTSFHKPPEQKLFTYYTVILQCQAFIWSTVPVTLRAIKFFKLALSLD